MSVVVARHYLDALAAVPEDPDAADLRAEAIAALVRAADRAERSGAPGRAAETYAEAAALVEQAGVADGDTVAAGWWEHAAVSASHAADFAATLSHADRAAELYGAAADPRAAARAQSLAATALRRAGRHTEARIRITAALEVLRPDPDHDTIAALTELATLETFGGSPDGHRLASETLRLGQALGVDAAVLCDLFIVRGLSAGFQNHDAEAAADLEYAVRLAERVGATREWTRASLNLASILLPTDPAGSAEAARVAVARARQIGDAYYLPMSIANLAVALLFAGDWSGADAVLHDAMEVDVFAGGGEFVLAYVAITAALRGDVGPRVSAMAELPESRASEDPQDLATVAVVDAFLAGARGEHADALRHARAALAHAPAVGISGEAVLWMWPHAVRTALQLDNAATVGELLTLLDGYPVGYLSPLLRAERSLARARLQARDGADDAAPALAAAVTELRAVGSPFHLAHALLDSAEYLSARGRASEAELLRDEARDIGERLGAGPLVARAANATVATAPR